MKCPVCGCENSTAYKTYKKPEANFRTRECNECLTRWVTVERFERIIPPKPYERKNK